MRRLALVMLAGCSIATSGAPSRYDGRVAPECTTTSVPAVLDASATILLGVVGVPLLLIGDCGSDEECPAVPGQIGAVSLIAAGMYAASAYSGFSNVSSCKAAIAKHEAMTRDPGYQRAASNVAP